MEKKKHYLGLITKYAQTGCMSYFLTPGNSDRNERTKKVSSNIPADNQSQSSQKKDGSQKSWKEPSVGKRVPVASNFFSKVKQDYNYGDFKKYLTTQRFKISEELSDIQCFLKIKIEQSNIEENFLEIEIYNEDDHFHLKVNGCEPEKALNGLRMIASHHKKSIGKGEILERLFERWQEQI